MPLPQFFQRKDSLAGPSPVFGFEHKPHKGILEQSGVTIDRAKRLFGRPAFELPPTVDLISHRLILPARLTDRDGFAEFRLLAAIG